MTTVAPRTTRPYDPADLSSTRFWSRTAAEPRGTFAELRATGPSAGTARSRSGCSSDPNDQGFWAVMRHADLVEVTKRHEDFLSGQGIVLESMPQELLDAGQGFIAMDPPRHTQVRRLLTVGLHPEADDAGSPTRSRRTPGASSTTSPGRARSTSSTEVAALVPMHNICDMVGVPEEHRRTVAHEAQFAGGWRDEDLMQGAGAPRPGCSSRRSYLRGSRPSSSPRAGATRRTTCSARWCRPRSTASGSPTTRSCSFFGLLIIAGNDTTRQSTSHGMKALTDFPDQRAWLLEDLDGRMARPSRRSCGGRPRS